MISQRECMFCHSINHIVEVHGHYHCTRCGRANWECCDGLSEQSVKDDEPEELDWHFDDEPIGSHTLMEDDEALGSAGFGTDEYYGFYGGDDY